MTRGRKPKSAETSKRMGNPGRRPPKVEPAFPLAPKSTIEPPMPLTQSAREAWNYLYQELVGFGVLKSTHYHTLALFCLHWGIVRDAHADWQFQVAEAKRIGYRDAVAHYMRNGLTKAKAEKRAALEVEKMSHGIVSKRERNGELVAVVENPLLGTIRRGTAECGKLISELGLSPSATARLATPIKTDDPLSKFMEKTAPKTAKFH